MEKKPRRKPKAKAKAPRVRSKLGRKSLVAPDLFLTELAETSKISLGYLSQIINQGKYPSVRVARALASALSMTTDEVLNRIENRDWDGIKLVPCLSVV